MASLIVVSIILSIMYIFSIAQKHNRQNFEHNRPGPIFKSLTTRYFLSFHSREAVQLGMSLFCFLFYLFFFPAILFFLPIMLNILLQVVIFCSKFSYIASCLTVTLYTYTPKLYTNIIVSYSYTDSKCQLLTRPNVLIVLLEYIDLFQSK